MASFGEIVHALYGPKAAPRSPVELIADGFRQTRSGYGLGDPEIDAAASRERLGGRSGPAPAAQRPDPVKMIENALRNKGER